MILLIVFKIKCFSINDWINKFKQFRESAHIIVTFYRKRNGEIFSRSKICPKYIKTIRSAINHIWIHYQCNSFIPKFLVSGLSIHIFIA